VAEETAVAQVVAEQPSFWDNLGAQGAQLYEWAHTTTGAPYWAVIVGCTIAVRLLIMPLTVMSLKSAGRMALAKPELDKLNDDFRRLGSPTPESRKKFFTDMRAIQAKYGASMGRSFAPVMAQMPVFVVFFSATSYLLRHNPDMATAGTLWFRDMTAQDPYMRLNLVAALVMHLSFRLGAETGQAPSQQTLVRIMSFAIPTLYLPFTMNFSQGMHLFWLGGSVAAISINVMLRKTAIGTMLGVPRFTAVGGIATPPVQPPAHVFASKAQALSASQLAKQHKLKHKD
jgi:YidC/Oxa1 family membrane protein insertase